MDVFADYFDGKIEQLLSNVEQCSQPEDGHIKGTIVELSLKELYKSLIPSFYDVSRGWIINSDGEKTDERDILIYDRRKAPVFMLDSSTGLLPIETILSDVQVKTSVRSSGVKKCIEKSKKLGRIDYSTLFAVKAEIGSNTVLEEFSKHDGKFYLDPAFNTIVIGSHGFYFFVKENCTLREYISEKDIIDRCCENIAPILKDPKCLKKIEKEAGFSVVHTLEQPKKLTINGIDITKELDEDIEVVYWCGVSFDRQPKETIRCYFAKLMSDLFSGSIGNYILKHSCQTRLFACVVRRKGVELFSKVDLKEGIGSMKKRFTISISGDVFSVDFVNEND